MLNVRERPHGMAGVTSPREDTWKAMFQKWFTGGVSARQIFPTICVHMCKVA
jgi:hypothetical protein